MSIVEYGSTQTVDTDKLVLHEDSIQGLTPKFRSSLKLDVYEVNRAWNTSGEAMKSCIIFLDDIKKNYPKQFKSICENELDFSDSIAYDLVKAAPWVRTHDIPARFLANISARTIRIIATEKEEKIREALTDMIISREGAGVSELDINKRRKELSGKAVRATKEIKEVIEKGKKELAPDASAETVKAWYKKEFDALDKKLSTKDGQVKDVKTRNEKLTKDNKELRAEIAELKKEVPTTEDSKNLIAMIKDNPAAVRQVLNMFNTAKEKQEAMEATAKETVAAL